MAITTNAYSQFLVQLGQKQIDLSGDEIWVALFTSAYTPNYNFDFGYFDLRGDCEMADQSGGTTLGSTADYSWNGQKLGTAWGFDVTKGATLLSANNITWSSLTGTFRYAVIYKWVAYSTDTVMIGCLDYGSDQTYAAQPFTIDFSNGVLALKSGDVTVTS